MDVIKVIGKRMSLAHPSGKYAYTYMYNFITKEMQIFGKFCAVKILDFE